MFKKLFKRITTPTAPATVLNTASSTYTITLPPATTIPQSYSYSTGVVGAGGAGQVTVGNITAAAANPSSWITMNSGIAGTAMGSFTITPPNHIITLSSNNQEIVRLNLDGSVTWANGVNIDAAAESFGQSLQMGAEMRAGVSKAVKLRMRDSVFEDLINIAKEKGSLTAEDLTYLLEASKIVEKLKGGN